MGGEKRKNQVESAELSLSTLHTAQSNHIRILSYENIIPKHSPDVNSLENNL